MNNIKLNICVVVIANKIKDKLRIKMF